jgi:hypothetical protein
MVNGAARPQQAHFISAAESEATSKPIYNRAAPNKLAQNKMKSYSGITKGEGEKLI